MLVVDLAAARAINSIANGASIAADCPVSRSEKRATSLSNRFFISFSDDLCSSGVLIIHRRTHLLDFSFLPIHDGNLAECHSLGFDLSDCALPNELQALITQIATNAKLEQRRLKSNYIRIMAEISETYGFQNRTALGG
jgi:hypothetical protein